MKHLMVTSIILLTGIAGGAIAAPSSSPCDTKTRVTGGALTTLIQGIRSALRRVQKNCKNSIGPTAPFGITKKAPAIRSINLLKSELGVFAGTALPTPIPGG